MWTSWLLIGCLCACSLAISQFLLYCFIIQRYLCMLLSGFIFEIDLFLMNKTVEGWRQGNSFVVSTFQCSLTIYVTPIVHDYCRLLSVDFQLSSSNSQIISVYHCKENHSNGSRSFDHLGPLFVNQFNSPSQRENKLLRSSLEWKISLTLDFLSLVPTYQKPHINSGFDLRYLNNPKNLSYSFFEPVINAECWFDEPVN